MNLPFNLVTVSVLTTAYGFIFSLALSANIVLIFIVLKRPTMRTTINYLFANMAAANLLVAVFIIPYAVRYLFAADLWFPGMVGQISCRLIHFAYAVSIMASILSFTAISLDQFYAILFPMKRVVVIRNIRFITLVIWISSVIFMSPYLAMFGVRKISGQHQCVYMVLNRIIMEIHFSFIFVFLYAFPLVLMATLYALIARKLWFRIIPGNIHSIHRQAAETSKRRVIRMLIIVIATFAVCWLPVHVFHMCAAFEPHVTRNMASHWSLLIVFIAHANSALNPCLQLSLNRKFRAEFLKLWAFWRNLCLWCFRKKGEADSYREPQISVHRFEAMENIKERIAKRRGRLYELSAVTKDWRTCPISLVQFSYYNKAVETES